MNDSNNRLKIKEIFHPIDISKDDHGAFYHALKLAQVAEANLTLFHVITDKSEVSGKDFPSAANTLQKWQVSDEKSVNCKIVTSKSADPVDSAVFHLEHSPTDLIVMATHARQGLSRLMERAIAEPIASESNARVLFLPENTNGFVDGESGRTRLNRVLVPVSSYPDPNPTLACLAVLLELMDNLDAEITLLHTGAETSFPDLDLPDSIAAQCTTHIQEGNIVTVVRNYSEQMNPNLIVMTTQGKRGLIKMLLGGNTEQILRTAGCAVLGIPCRESTEDNN